MDEVLGNLLRSRAEIQAMAEVCRAWDAFHEVVLANVTPLRKLGVDFAGAWYGRFAEWQMRFPELRDQRALRQAINEMMRSPYFVDDGDPALFKRRDIYDKMAYASFPLNWFVETTADCMVTFSMALPMVFAVSSFRMKRTHKAHQGNNWWGRLYLHDGRIAKYYEDREVAERVDFPYATTREAMFEWLLDEVRRREEDSLFTVTGDSLIGAMIKAESELLLTAAGNVQ